MKEHETVKYSAFLLNGLYKLQIPRKGQEMIPDFAGNIVLLYLWKVVCSTPIP